MQADFEKVYNELLVNPLLGTPMGGSKYKIRFAIASKNKGKSGGGRIITYVQVDADTVLLLTIYDKADLGNVSDGYLEQILREEGY